MPVSRLDPVHAVHDQIEAIVTMRADPRLCLLASRRIAVIRSKVLRGARKRTRLLLASTLSSDDHLNVVLAGRRVQNGALGAGC